MHLITQTGLNVRMQFPHGRALVRFAEGRERRFVHILLCEENIKMLAYKPNLASYI